MLGSIFVNKCSPMTGLKQCLNIWLPFAKDQLWVFEVIIKIIIIIGSMSPSFMFSSKFCWISFELEFMFSFYKTEQNIQFLIDKKNIRFLIWRQFKSTFGRNHCSYQWDYCPLDGNNIAHHSFQIQVKWYLSCWRIWARLPSSS